MPNHVTTNCVITGPKEEISRFVEKMIQEEKGEKFLDFNQVIPMPDCIRNSESSSRSLNAMAVLGYELSFINPVPKFVGKEESLGSILNYPWVKEKGITTIEDLEKELMKTDPDLVERGKEILDLYNKYGSVSWYEWSIANWGTKWNSYGFKMIKQEDSRVEFEFDTAWSFPNPVFDAMRKEFPPLKFDFASFDEGNCFCLVGTYQGEFNAIDYYSGKGCDPVGNEVVASIYKRVYGECYKPYDEDGEEDVHADLSCEEYD